jgi:hypothetical protein
MSVRALANSAQLELVTLHATIGALVLWTGVLVREWPQLVTYGRLCGEPQSLFGHCPMCWPAAALTVVSVAGLSLLAARNGRRA